MKILKHSLLAGLVLCLLAAGAAIGFVPRTASADIQSYEWLNSAYEGWDDFLNANVIAYEAGTSATLIARVYNPWEKEITLDYGRVELGWAASPVESVDRPPIGAHKTALLTWNIDIPSTSSASNLQLHTYKITVQYDVPELVSDQKWERSGNDLAVYSPEQVGCRDLIQKWTANNTAYSFWGYEGRQAMTEATYTYNKASSEYEAAQFEAAQTDYQAALDKQNEAIEKDAAAALTAESALTLEGTGGVKGLGFLQN